MKQYLVRVTSFVLPAVLMLIVQQALVLGIGLSHWQDLLAIMLPYTLACIFFGMTVSCLVRYRENAMLIMVFVSVPLALMIVFMKKNAVTVTCKLLTHSEMSVTPKNVLIKMNQNFC